MRPALLVLLASTLAAGCAASQDQSAGFAPDPYGATAQAPLEVIFESTDGRALPTFLSSGSLYVGGERGERYNLRLVNNTGGRVEAVVAVDGRDVISGAEGNYKKQRGYIVEPYSSVVVEGFRRSMQEVAAFQFTSVADSYTARRGSPQHVGVVGVAVFAEKPGRKKDQYAVAPRPYYQGGSEAPPPEPFPGSQSAPKSKGAADAAFEGEAEEAASSPSMADDDGGGYAAPSQRSHHELGTQYGESTQSAVAPVEFKRKRKRKPDAVMTVYYDSFEGLQARGIAGSSVPVYDGRYPGR